MSEIDITAASEEYFARIRRAALVLTGNPWDADDLAQETFLVLARSADRFDGRSKLYTFLYGILLNLDRRNRRRQGVWQRKLKVLWAEPSPSAPAAETPVEADEWKSSLWSHVAQLADNHRQVLVLRFSERLSYEEIAGVLDCPLGTVKSRMHHALTNLRERLMAAGPETYSIPENLSEDRSRVV